MKVILTRDIHELGKKNEIKDVSDGYAKNFLFKNGFATLATPEKIKTQENIDKTEKAKQQEKKLQAEILSKELKNKKFIFSLKTGKKGELFASLGKKEIELKLKEWGIHAEVILGKPFKAIGDYNVELNLGFGKHTNIIVQIIASK